LRLLTLSNQLNNRDEDLSRLHLLHEMDRCPVYLPSKNMGQFGAAFIEEHTECSPGLSVKNQIKSDRHHESRDQRRCLALLWYSRPGAESRLPVAIPKLYDQVLALLQTHLDLLLQPSLP